MTKLWITLLFAAVGLFLLLGICLPIIQFERLYFFSENPSLIQIVLGLWDEGDFALSLLVGTLSIGFPILKLFALGVEAIGAPGRASALRRAMPHLSRWSMMDVMLVAIVVFAAKSSGLAQAATQPGLWFYAASAVVATLLPSLIGRMRG